MRPRILLFSVFLIALMAICTNAQTGRNGRGEPLSKMMREKLVEMQIEEQKKDFDKLVERSELVAKLSKEIETSFSENKKLTDKDRKKLEQVDSLLKKIRRELRASKANTNEKIPNSVVLAIEHLKENTSKLFEEVKKTTRHSISAVAIQSSNTVLKLVKFLRFGRK